MTTTDRATVLGVFSSREQAEQAVEELHRAGFSYADIGFVTRDEKGSDHTVIPGVAPNAGTGPSITPLPGVPPIAPVAVSTEPTANTPPDVINTTDVPVETDETTNRIAAGATGGGVVGGLLGAAATLLIPGIGPITAAGVLVGVLTGLLAGSVAGGLIGALTSLGVSEDEAHYYSNEVAAGRVLVTVHAPERQVEAREILRRFGATEMQTRSNAPLDHTNSPASQYQQTYEQQPAYQQPTNPAARPNYVDDQARTAHPEERPVSTETPDYKPWQQPHPGRPEQPHQ